MKKSEYKRLLKIESKIMKIAESFGLETSPVEFDIIPPQKMLEIMAYRLPTNISNWKYGRDYERLRTIDEHVGNSLPYEVVLNSNPYRAYLMKENTFAVQVLVMAHVIGHTSFMTMNKFFQESRRDIVDFMYEASRRFNNYERMYGIEEVEKVIDAGHSIQFHSSPFDTETEDEKRKRIYNQQMQKNKKSDKILFGDIVPSNKPDINEDINLFNQKLLRELKNKTPVEPTEDILRYIIDNSNSLEDWHKDILETLRVEGQYLWPLMKTKYSNEGFATYFHEKICDVLFKDGDLSASEHSQFNYTNSLVKANHPYQLNPYHLGFEIWKDIKEKYDKGKYTSEYKSCTSIKEKEEWNTKENNGDKKILETVRVCTDWFLMQDFLTPELVDKLDLYLYKGVDKFKYIDIIRTKDDAEIIARNIIDSFSHSGIPKIEITKIDSSGEMFLVHKWAGSDLDKKHTEETLKHIYRCWGNPVTIETKKNGHKVVYRTS